MYIVHMYIYENINCQLIQYILYNNMCEYNNNHLINHRDIPTMLKTLNARISKPQIFAIKNMPKCFNQL